MTQTNQNYGGKSRVPRIQHFFAAVGAGTALGGFIALIGVGPLAAAVTGVFGAAVFLREVCRGGTSWHELRKAAAIVLVLATAAWGVEAAITGDSAGGQVGPPKEIGVGGRPPHSMARTPLGVLTASRDGTVSLVTFAGVLRQRHFAAGLTGVQYGFGSAWAVRGRELIRAEGGSLETVGSRAYAAEIVSLAVSPLGIWIAMPAAGTIGLVDPHSSAITRRIHARRVRAIAAAAGSLWVAADSADGSRGELLQYSFSGGLRGKFPISPRAKAIAVDGRYVWISYRSRRALTRLDPRLGDVDEVQVSSAPAAIAVGQGGLWIVDRETQELSHVDSAQGTAVTMAFAGREPVGVAVWRSWIFVSGADGILRIFPYSPDAPWSEPSPAMCRV